MTKHILLFDMDGTLTPARKPMTEDIADALEDILNAGHEIGIVTGSDMDFVIEQCQILFDRDLHKVIDFWPCNGSKQYKWSDEKSDLELLYSVNMRELLGDKNFNLLISSINRAHTQALSNIVTFTDIPVTGRFISFRGSSINYCPIGRDLNQKGREMFEAYDENIPFREAILKNIRSMYILSTHNVHDVEFALGGKISIDIYPTGHSKKFVLGKIKAGTTPWFVGDNVGPYGNDTEIYKAVEELNPLGAYKTDGPDRTCKIIKEILDKIATS